MKIQKKKGKILFITNKAPSYRIPLFNELSKRLSIKFIFTHEDKNIEGLEADYISLKGIGYKKYRIHPRLRKILKKEKPKKLFLLPPDPLHTINNIILYRFCKKNKIPFSILIGRWEYKEKPLKQKLTEPIHNKILKKAESCFVYGTKSEKWALKREIKKEKIIRTYNINPHIYKNLKEKPKKLPKFKNKKVILYVGRLLKRKGVDYLINAFSKIKDKDAVLVIVGGGDFYKLGAKSEEAKLRELVKELGLEKRVIFTGHIPFKETKKYYKTADLFVCPSITTQIGEPWGHVIEESMSFGLPVITTDAVGAAEDLIEEGKNGFVVPEKNSEKLREKIQKLLKDEKLRENMEKESLNIIKQDKFSFESIVNKWVEGLEG